MAKTYRHYGEVRSGVRIYSNPMLHSESLSLLEGKRFEEVIQEKQEEASVDQHGYYRGGIIMEALEAEMFGGWTEKELHSFFGDMFLTHTYGKVLKLADGTIHTKILKDKTSLSGIGKKEMTKFIDQVIQWLAEQNIVVKTPAEYYYGKYATVSFKRSSK